MIEIYVDVIVCVVLCVRMPPKVFAREYILNNHVERTIGVRNTNTVGIAL
jgi:hypothetical protein